MAIPEDSDEVLFGDETSESTPSLPEEELAPWKVLIVDDEDQVHAVTRMVLSDFEFKGRSLEFVAAYSGKEAREKILAHPDIGVILLDVVMETDSAGLDFARFVRDELRNHHVRIILRTGQPGQAPERRVIVEYDINDYKEKAELTAQKLYSTMTTALRSYKDIMTIEMNRRGLEKIIIGSAALFQSKSIAVFLSGILQQIASLLECDVHGFMLSSRSTSDENHSAPEYLIVAATDRFATYLNRSAEECLDARMWEIINRALVGRQSIYEKPYLMIYFESARHRDMVVYLESKRGFEPMEHDLIKLFCSNASIGLDHLLTYDRSNDERGTSQA